MCTALLAKQVKRRAQVFLPLLCLRVEGRSLVTHGPNTSMPALAKGGAGSVRSEGKSAILGSMGLPLRRRQIMQFFKKARMALAPP